MSHFPCDKLTTWHYLRLRVRWIQYSFGSDLFLHFRLISCSSYLVSNGILFGSFFVLFCAGQGEGKVQGEGDLRYILHVVNSPFDIWLQYSSNCFVPSMSFFLFVLLHLCLRGVLLYLWRIHHMTFCALKNFALFTLFPNSRWINVHTNPNYSFNR